MNVLLKVTMFFVANCSEKYKSNTG